MKPKCPTKEKKGQEKQKKMGGEKAKRKYVKSAGSLLTTKTISKCCFLDMPEIQKLSFCIWTRRPRSAQPVNSFVIHLSSS